MTKRYTVKFHEWRFQTDHIDKWFNQWHALWFFRKVYQLFRSKNPNKTSKEISFIDAISHYANSDTFVPEEIKHLTKKNISDFFKQTLWASNKWDFLEKLWIINMETRKRFDPSAIDYSWHVALILAHYAESTWKKLEELIH